MTIKDIISKHYDNFLSMCMNTNLPVYDGKTSEDILNDCVITVINKYGDKDIDETEGYEYFKKTFLMEEKFAHKRKSRDKLIFTDNIRTYEIGTDES